YSSGSDFLMRSKVTKIEERGKSSGSLRWPTRYRVTMGDGLAVFTNQVVVGTGLGGEKLPDLDADSMTIIKRERAKIDFSNPEKLPGIVTYGEALGLANLSATGRDAYRATPRPAPKQQQTGIRVTTDLGAQLEGNADGQRVTFNLSEVRDWQFDKAKKT